MANHVSALKRHRQSLRRRDRNRAAKSRIKTERKKLATTLASGDKVAYEKQAKLVQKLLARTAAKGRIHKRTAARLQSRTALSVNKATKTK